MTIRLKCECGKKLSAPDSATGKRGRCPACRRLVVVPHRRREGGPESEPLRAEVHSAAPRPWRADERRGFRRVLLGMHAFCRLGEKAVEGATHDLSASGLMMSAGGALPVSSSVVLEARPTPLQRLTMGGVVRRCAPTEDRRFQLAVEFTDPSEEDCLRLGRFAGTARHGSGLRERRRYVRLRTALPVDFRYPPLTVWQRGHVVELSVGGMMFTVSHVIHPDTELEVQLDLHLSETVLLQGVVLDCHRDHSGQDWRVRVVFVNIPPEQRVVLQDYICSELAVHRGA